jgi:hypothetical protein
MIDFVVAALLLLPLLLLLLLLPLLLPVANMQLADAITPAAALASPARAAAAAATLVTLDCRGTDSSAAGGTFSIDFVVVVSYGCCSSFSCC